MSGQYGPCLSALQLNLKTKTVGNQKQQPHRIDNSSQLDKWAANLREGLGTSLPAITTHAWIYERLSVMCFVIRGIMKSRFDRYWQHRGVDYRSPPALPIPINSDPKIICMHRNKINKNFIRRAQGPMATATEPPWCPIVILHCVWQFLHWRET